jgi:hypothetical protein
MKNLANIFDALAVRGDFANFSAFVSWMARLESRDAIARNPFLTMLAKIRIAGGTKRDA